MAHRSLGLPRLFLLLALLAALHSGAARAACNMVEMGRFPVDLSHNQVHIKGLLNGTAVNILVDTGASESMIVQGAAERAGLKPVRERRYQMVGVQGKTEMYRARVDELIIGNYPVRDRVWPVIPAGEFLADVGMILGADFWSKVDIEINLAAGELVLWDNRDCGKAPLAYWNSEFMLALLADTRDKIRADAVVSGHTVRAMIDTGAGVSFIDRRVADRIGYRREDGADGPQKVSGIGNRRALDSFIGVFDSFTLGDLTVKNARLRIIEMEQNTQETGTRAGGSLVDFDNLIIGADFLLANHVLIANSQGYLYMTYNGGPVFQTAVLEGEAQQALAGVAPAGSGASVIDLLPAEMSEAYVNALKAQAARDFPRMEALFSEVLAEYEADGNADTRDSIIPLQGLANALVEQRKYAEAEPVLQRLLGIIERTVGPDHFAMAGTLLVHGETLLSLHRYPEALASLQRALPIAEQAFGADHDGTVSVLTSLGTAQEAVADYARAGETYGRVVTILEQRDGGTQSDVARALLDVGRMAESREQYKEAIAIYQRARDMFAAEPGSEAMVEFTDDYIRNARLGDVP